MSKFKHAPSPDRSEPDPAALAAFAAGAETRSIDLVGNTEMRSTVSTELRTSVDTVSRNSVSAAKKMTVLLDRDRWLVLKQICAEEDRSGQKILIDALDLYFAAKNS
jgi:hypothetical protein